MAELNSCNRIFFDGVVDSSNIVSVLTTFSAEIEQNMKNGQAQLDIYNSKNLESLVTNSDRKFNEKRIPNPLRTCIQLKAGITLNSPILLQTSNDNEKIKTDLEKIKTKLEKINAHKVDIDLLIDMLVCGVAFGYTLSSERKNVLFGKFSPKNTTYIQSNDIGNPVSLIINKATVTQLINNQKVEVIKYTCFTDTNKFILESSGKDIEIIEISNHGLPNNPVAVYEANEELQSLLKDLFPMLISYMLTSSNLDNDMLNKINTLLALIGFEMTPETITKIFNRENNVISIPPNTNGETGNKDVKFVTSSANMQDMMEHKSRIWQEMLEIAFLPKDAGNRAETGQAMKFGGNYVVTSMMCSMLELVLSTPKRQEIENIIEIMKVNKELLSDINSNDIKIAYDHNRLLDIRELAETMEILMRVGMATDDMLDICGVATNNVKIENGVKLTQKNKNKIQMLINDKLLTTDDKFAKIDMIYKESNNGNE